MTRKSGSLFSGTAALDMAAEAVFGVKPAWFSDIDPGACALLKHHYPNVPNLGDITAVDWDQVEPVWMLTGGFPCTDLSLAGAQAGLKPGTRSGLWIQMAYAISKLRPQVVLIENVRGLASAEAHSDVEPCSWCVGVRKRRNGKDEPALRAFGAVLGDLASRGYDAVWCGLPASDVGACHARFRFFILAFARDTEVRGRHVESDAERGGEPAGPAGGSGLALADASSDGREQGRSEPAGFFGGPDAAECGASAADSNSVAVREQPESLAGRRSQALAEQSGAAPANADIGRILDWGQYGPAIQRWEQQLSRPAPYPTIVGDRGGRVLNPALPEWMMGLPEGWITDVPGLTRAQQLKLAGNGVVKQQAVEAYRYLLSLVASEAQAAA